MTDLRTAVLAQEQAWFCPESPEHRYKKPGHCEACGKTLVLAQQAEQKPGQQPRSAAPLLTPRELELLHGLIERELWHARTCDAILARPDGNHRMASAQKGWDMERVALLRKLGGIVA